MFWKIIHNPRVRPIEDRDKILHSLFCYFPFSSFSIEIFVIQSRHDE